MFLHSTVYYPSWGRDIFQPQLFKPYLFTQSNSYMRSYITILNVLFWGQYNIWDPNIGSYVRTWLSKKNLGMARGIPRSSRSSRSQTFFHFSIPRGIDIRDGNSGVKFPRPQFLLHGSTWMCRPSSSHAIDRDNDRQLFFSGPNEFCIGSPCALGSHSSVEKKMLSEFLFQRKLLGLFK